MSNEQKLREACKFCPEPSTGFSKDCHACGRHIPKQESVPKVGDQEGHALALPVESSDGGEVLFTDMHMNYVVQYGGSCRGCADENGVCPNSGLPCDGYRKAIQHVFSAIQYGVNNRFIPSPFAAPQPRQEQAVYEPAGFLLHWPAPGGGREIVYDESRISGDAIGCPVTAVFKRAASQEQAQQPTTQAQDLPDQGAVNHALAGYIIGQLNSKRFGERVTPQLEAVIRDALARCDPLYTSRSVARAALVDDSKSRERAGDCGASSLSGNAMVGRLTEVLDRLAAWLRNPANAQGIQTLEACFSDWCKSVESVIEVLRPAGSSPLSVGDWVELHRLREERMAPDGRSWYEHAVEERVRRVEAERRLAVRGDEPLLEALQERFKLLRAYMPGDPREALAVLLRLEISIALDPRISRAVYKRTRGVECSPAVSRIPGEEEASHLLSDDFVDWVLQTPIPGGSVAAHWFLPHETDIGLTTVRNVVRRMVGAALSRVADPGLPRPLDPNALEHAINMMPWRDEVLDAKRLRQFGEQLWLQFCSRPSRSGD